MAFNELVEQSAAYEKYVDSENTRRFRAVCHTSRRYARNSQGIYVPYSDEERGSDQDLRVISAAGNLQARKGNSDWGVWDNGFNSLRARKIVRVQRFNGSTWDALSLPMVEHRYLSRDGQDSAWSGYGWRFRDASNNELDAVFTQRLGVSKWVYRFTPAAAGRYRLVLGVDILQAAQQMTRMNLTSIQSGTYTNLGESRATWHWGAFDTLAFDWSDMITSGVYGSHVLRSDGAAVTSRGVNLAAGETVTIDPTLTADAGFSGGGASGDSAWGTDPSFGNSHACGAVGGNELRSVNRFDISAIGVSDTISDTDLSFYVPGQSGVSYNTGIIRAYNGDGSGDPQTDAYATAFSRAGNTTHQYISGDTFIRTTGAKSFDLGANGDADILVARAAGSTFSIAYSCNTISGNSYWYSSAYNNSTSANQPDLVVIYTAAGGGSGSGSRLMLMGVGS